MVVTINNFLHGLLCKDAYYLLLNTVVFLSGFSIVICFLYISCSAVVLERLTPAGQ